jgi:hypothetical protein
MPNVLSIGRVNSVFGNVGSVIADTLQTTANKDKIQVAPQLVWIPRHLLD